MAEEFFIPKLGQTVEEVTIIKWLAADGAKVALGQEIIEVQTDKTIFPVEANASGYLHLGPYQANDVVPVLTVVAVIGGPNDRFDLKPGQTASRPEPVSAAAAAIGASAPAAVTITVPASRRGAKVFASPRARRFARERQVDLAWVTPTGGGGIRVVESDVAAYLAQMPSLPAPAGPDAAWARTMPGFAHATLTMTADAAQFVALQQRLAPEAEHAWGFVPDDMDLLLFAVSRALRRFPHLNAHIQSDRLTPLADVNVAVTVETDAGESWPVLRHADRRGLREIGTVRRALADRARTGASLPEDLTGGAFTVSNLGEFDADGYAPVVRPPQAAALGVGSIAARPFVRDVGINPQLVAWPTLSLTLSFDSRLPGSSAARFLQYLKRSIEQPFLWLLY